MVNVLEQQIGDLDSEIRKRIQLDDRWDNSVAISGTLLEGIGGVAQQSYLLNCQRCPDYSPRLVVSKITREPPPCLAYTSTVCWKLPVRL